MEVFEKDPAPQIAIGIDRRSDPITARQGQPCIAIGQRLQTIIAIREREIRAVDVDMAFNSRRNGIG